MQLKLHNIIEVDHNEGTAYIIFKGKSYEFDLDNVGFIEYCEKVVDNAYNIVGGYEVPEYEKAYDTIEDYIEEETAASILKDILENVKEDEFLTYAIIQND